jgi:hypothetical protein
MGSPVAKLRVNMPISLRKPGDGADNAVTIARFELPVPGQDFTSVMQEVGETVKKWRKEPALQFTQEMAEMSRLLPAELLAAVAQASDLTASNVPGVPVPVWLAGARVMRMYPLVATVGAAVNITMLTYDGTASFGISSDDAAVDDREELVRCLRAGVRTVTGSPVAVGTPLTRRKKQAAGKTAEEGETAASGGGTDVGVDPTGDGASESKPASTGKRKSSAKTKGAGAKRGARSKKTTETE